MSYWYGGLDNQLRGILILEYPKKISVARLRKKMQFAGVLGPYATEQELRHQIRLGSLNIKVSKPMKNNPKLPSVDLNGAVEIYENIHAIEAKKGSKSLWPKENFRHDFAGSKTKIYGLKNGNLLIVGKKRLWKMFQYSKSDV